MVCHCYRVTDDQVYLLVLNCRLSPRRKTERDVPETDGTGGRRRRMSLRWKAKTGGPSVFPSWGYPPVPSVLAFAVSKTDVPETDGPETDDPETDDPETDSPETDVAETDGSETDDRETEVPETDGAETDVAETDAPETEEGRDGCPRDGWRPDGCP